MEKAKFAVLCGLFLSVWTITGCSNGQPCYQCSRLEGVFKAIKQGDTITFTVQTKVAISDSINYYIGLGYVIDTNSFNYYPFEGGNYICGNGGYNSELAVGDTCWLARE